MDPPNYLQTLLSSHGGVDSEESLMAIIKQLKSTRERVRSECANVFSKGYAPFLKAADFLCQQQAAQNSTSKVSLEAKFREMDGPTLQKHVILTNEEYLQELFYLLQQFESLGFQRRQQQEAEGELAVSPMPSSPYSQGSVELSKTTDHRPASLVTELVSSVAERLKVYCPPDKGRFLLVDQEKLAFLDEREEWRSVRLFLLTDVLIIATKKSKLASLTATRKLYALERLILLQDLKIINYQDSARIQNAWKIEHGSGYGVFQCISAEQKAFLIQAIYDAKNSLLGRSSSKSKKEEKLKNEVEVIEEKEYHVEQRTLAFTRKYLPSVLLQDTWSQMHSFLTELRGHVAVLDYDLASVVIERLEDALAKAPDCPDTLKVQLAFDQLVGCLKNQLLDKITLLAASAPLLTVQVRAVEDMIRAKLALDNLGGGEEAQDAFLEARLQLLADCTKQLKLGRGTLPFLKDFCHLNSCLLKETGAVFEKVFGANTTFLFWLRIQIKEMAGTVARILFSKTHDDVDFFTEAIRCACNFAKDMSAGIDTVYEFQLALEPFLSEYLQKCSQLYLKMLAAKMDNGDYDIHEVFSDRLQRLSFLSKILKK